MRSFLVLLFGTILVAMLAITVSASLEQNIVTAGRELITDRWFQATLLDAYFGFITFYVWVAYKEQTAWSRGMWFVLIMCLGNIAMAIYMLIQLARLPKGEPLSKLLLRSDSVARHAAG
jgi:hypothetical protein